VRRAIVLLSAVLVAVAFSSFAAVSVRAQATDQYDPSEGADPVQRPGGASSAPPPGQPSGEEAADRLADGTTEVVSQGSVVGRAPSPEAAARAAADLAEEEELPDYSQVVDNTTEGRFGAPKSREISAPTAHGGSYASLSTQPAAFKVTVPTGGDYSVYAWWPAAPAGAPKASGKFSIPVASGDRSVASETVDQARDGGMWIRLGAFELPAGERTVRLSGKGAAADAIAIVRGEIAAPPDDSYSASQAPAAGRDGSSRATAESRAASSGRAVVRSARKWLGTRYRYATCTRGAMSCTCLTKRAWSPHGHKLPMTENGQWRYEPSRHVRKSDLKPGDIVYFKEGNSRSITHVGIFSGRGNIVHASSYYKYEKVVESKMRYVTGYFGASRLRPR
jgi:cell wall-associated NlpC family hydrolase